MGASSRKTVSRDTKPSRSKKAHDKQADQATTPPSTAGDSDEDAPGELIEDYGIHPSIERPEALGHGSVTCNPTEAASLITAGEEAKSVFGQSLTIPDMHKPKADEPRARKLKLRKDPKILNMNRPCNIEATLNHIRGTRAVQMCKSCTRGHGPFTDCVFVEGSMMAACANCWFNACGTRCSFQGQSSQPFALMATRLSHHFPNVLHIPENTHCTTRMPLLTSCPRFDFSSHDHFPFSVLEAFASQVTYLYRHHLHAFPPSP